MVSFAATSGSLYSYDLTTAPVLSRVANGAETYGNVSLKLEGNWSPSISPDKGIHFTGNTSNAVSVGSAIPATGDTINVPATQAFGSIVRFTYEAPVTGTCFSDSHNISQIGRFAAGQTQIKIQLSNCGVSKTAVYPQCRMAGTNSSNSDSPKTGSLALVDGGTYIVMCAKDKDPVSGQATMELKTTRVDTAGSNEAADNFYAITRTGRLQSASYLSVANKYKLPAQSNNTDQFTGDVAKVAYCTNSTYEALMDCLSTEVPEATPDDVPPTEPPIPPIPPEPPVPDPLIELVGNNSLEANLTGWQGKYNSTSQISRSAGGYDGSYSIRAIDGGAKGITGFTDAKYWVSGASGKATTAGRLYTASVWVKPDAIGQVMTLRLRELNAAGDTIVNKGQTVTATSTDWIQMTTQLTADGTGHPVVYQVYASNVAAGQGFNADLLSLKAAL